MPSSMNTTKLAEIAGVSQATVSRVMNGGRGVAPETVRAVRKVIEDSGYQPARGGRGRPAGSGGMSGRRRRAGTGTIALVIVDDFYLRHPLLALAKIRGVQKAANEARLNLLVAEVEKNDPLPPLLAEGKVDGVLLWGNRVPERLRESTCGPIVWLSSHSGDPGDGVLPGNEFIGRMAADYLVKAGHRELAYLSLSDVHPGYEARGQAFAYAAHLAGARARIVMEDAAIGGVALSGEEGRIEKRVLKLVERLLALSQRPTGVFVADDQVTALVYMVLRDKGIRPKEDLTIISCNNERPYLMGLRPRPATIDLAPEITGRRAIEQLLWRIRHPNEKRRVQVMVEPILVPGE
jgi:DNA-binding LacI/PurR family transcriptional regulator